MSMSGMNELVPTLTLGELYVQQGLLGRAREIYRQLAKSGSPDQRDEAARRLLALGPSAQREIEILRALALRVRERRRRT